MPQLPWKKTNVPEPNASNPAKTRYCEECGAELPSTRKHDLCEDCQREAVAKKQKIAAGGGGVVLLAIPAIKKCAPKALPYLKKGATFIKNIVRP